MLLDRMGITPADLLDTPQPRQNVLTFAERVEDRGEDRVGAGLPASSCSGERGFEFNLPVLLGLLVRLVGRVPGGRRLRGRDRESSRAGRVVGVSAVAAARSDRRNDAGALQFGERVVVEPPDALADGGVGLGEAGESYVAQAVQDRHRIEETRRVHHRFRSGTRKLATSEARHEGDIIVCR